MTPTTLLTLATRCEEAGEEMTACMLDEAWEAIAAVSAKFRAFACEPVSGFGTNAGRFGALMDARAYTEAAAMIVPQGWDWSVSNLGEDGACAEVWGHGYQEDTRIHSFLAKTTALCLVVASLRAIAGERG